MVLAYPDFNQAWLAWFGLVPLLIGLYGRHPITGFILSLVHGGLFFAGICDWIMDSPGYTLSHHLYLGLFLGLPFGFFGLIYCYLSRRLRADQVLLATPFIWVVMEYLRGNFAFLAFPWGLVAHSQYHQPVVIQIAAVTGSYGVSFIIVLVNAALAALLLNSLRQCPTSKALIPNPPAPGGIRLLILLASASVAGTLFYGHAALQKPPEAGNLKVSVVQGNIDQHKKFAPRYATSIIQTYSALTFEAAKDGAELVVWPEAATPRAIKLDKRLHQQMRRLSEKAGVHLLMGSTHHQKFKRENPRGVKYYNSAFLIAPELNVPDQRYDKIILVPFGEYLPLQGKIPWKWFGIPDLASYQAGSDLTVFETGDYRFGVSICWESIFPHLSRELVKKGAQFLVNITNESWYRETQASYQFVAISVFRAVENRVPVVRCANTGISCFIDSFGRIVGQVQDETGRSVYVRGQLTQDIVAADVNTFYNQYGEWLVWMSGAVVVFACAAALVRGRTRRHPAGSSIPSRV
jgi:apolipoprotein N-acyltransferase